MRESGIMEPMETRILYPKKSRAFLMMAVAALLIAMGVFLIYMGNRFGWIVVAFFGMLFLVSVIMTIPNSTYLAISADGFGIRNLFRYHFVAWGDVREFGVFQIQHSRMVGWKYSDAYKARPGMRRMNARLVGYEGMLPDTYGLRHEDLATLMNACLARFTTDP